MNTESLIKNIHKFESDIEGLNSSLETIVNDNANWNNNFAKLIINAWDGQGGNINADTITVSQVYNLWDSLITKYPTYFTKTILGKDESGTYDIWKISFNYRTINKAVVIANIHGCGTGGDAKVPAIALYSIFKEMLENGDSNKILQFLKYNIGFEIIPIANPWGFDNNSRYNSRDVDINRNFDYRWSDEPVENHKGTAPFSEIETQHIKKLIDDNKTCKAYFDLHSYVNEGGKQLDVMVTQLNSIEQTACLSVSNYYKNKGINSQVLLTGSPTSVRYANYNYNIPACSVENFGALVNLPDWESDSVSLRCEWVANCIYTVVMNCMYLPKDAKPPKITSDAWLTNALTLKNKTNTLISFDVANDYLKIWDNTNNCFAINDTMQQIRVDYCLPIQYMGSGTKSGFVQVEVLKNGKKFYRRSLKQEYVYFDVNRLISLGCIQGSAIVDVTTGDKITLQMLVNGFGDDEIKLLAGYGETWINITKLS